MNKKISSRFISIEGIDGAGKSSNINALVDFLDSKSIPVYLTREPGGTELGEKLREILLHKTNLSIHDEAELMLMYAARLQHVEEVIKPKLAEGTWVISDRFNDASFAYQGAGRGLSLERIQELENWVLKGFLPDLTVVFNLTVEESLARTQGRNTVTTTADNDRFELQNNEFKHRVNDYYHGLESCHSRKIFHLNAMQPIDNVQLDFVNFIDELWFSDKS